MRALYIGILMFTVYMQSDAIEPQMKPLGEYSGSPLLLEMADLPKDATTAYFVRRPNAEPLTAWEPIYPYLHNATGKLMYWGEHGERLQFRHAVLTNTHSTMATVSDFERPGSFLVLGFESSLQVFQCRYSVVTPSAVQGEHCLLLKVTRHDETEAKEDDVFGFLFTDQIPTRDWSRYRYLEFFFASDLPEVPNLLIQGKGDLHEKPLSTFYVKQDKNSGWHSVSIDLDEIFDDPHERSEIKVFALTHPVKSTKVAHTYEIKFDAIRLWEDEVFVETQIDKTPPSVPVINAAKIEEGQIHWTWEPAIDEESGIKGYAFSWSKSSRDNPPDEIMTTEPKASFSFVRPPNLTTYHLKVKACNHAGGWSDAVLESMIFNPKDYK